MSDEVTNSATTSAAYSSSATSSTIAPSIKNDDIHKSLYSVIIQNNVEEFTEILINNVSFDINKPLKGVKDGTDDKNALMIACSLDCYDIVKYLLTHMNIDINLQDKKGETALYHASALGNVRIVKLLLKYNPKLDLENKDKVTPLIISSYNGHTGVVKLLLDKGKSTSINVNYQDNLRKTALSFAALEGHPHIVELLLKHGANVNLADKLGWTPLMLAAYSGRANICRQLLIAKADKTCMTENNQTASTLARDGGFHHVSEMIERFTHNQSNASAYDEENIGIGRKSHSHYFSYDSRKFSTGSRLRTEMLPRDENTWWVYVSWVVTAFFLDRFLIKYGKMSDERIRQAWREKFTLCFIVFIATVFIAMMTFGFVTMACGSTSPPIPLPVINEFWGNNNKIMILRGKIYNVENYFKSGGHRPIVPYDDITLEPVINQYFGKDIGELFPVNDNAIGCKKRQTTDGLSLCKINTAADKRYHCHSSLNSLKTLESLFVNRYVSISWDEIKDTKSKKLFSFKGKVYDLTDYLSPANADRWLGNDNITTNWLENLIGKDVTTDILSNKNGNIKEIVNCFEHFQIGEVEGVTYGCAGVTVIVVFISSIATVLVLMKLLSAVAFDNFISKQMAKVSGNDSNDDIFNQNKKNVIIMVPCYSEGYDSMKDSFDSLAATAYPDSNKLFFIIADGNITGSGNDRSTPDILIDLITPFNNENFNDVQARSYLSIGEGTKRHNMAKVYTGYYNYQGRNIPTILVVKVGNKEERKYPKAGNRGKRDSQLVLMQLLQHAFNNDKMSRLEFEIFEKVRKLTNKTVDEYEFVVMVDADTIVKEDSLSNMVNCMNNDPSVVGLCGETKILNKTTNWVSMIQVFEYYLSHHLGKTFESVYSCVTCLPGCFCMYRVYSYNYDGLRVPILIEENIMNNYSTNEVDTLHQKNLLLLGEDRYLTTLMLRAFPKRKTLYCPSAVCETIVPTEFSVLLSQRRRWINGTIHNMFELVVTSELPGRFCFSMQFAVFLELIGTFTSPFALCYILFTLIGLMAGFPFQTSVIFTTISFSLQLFLAIFTSYSPIIVLWFFVYLVSVPIWYIILPLYSFWNFDDFSWGATRKLNEDGSTAYSDTIFDRFNPKSVPLKRWDQWMRSTGVIYEYI